MPVVCAACSLVEHLLCEKCLWLSRDFTAPLRDSQMTLVWWRNTKHLISTAVLSFLVASQTQLKSTWQIPTLSRLATFISQLHVPRTSYLSSVVSSAATEPEF